LLLLEEKWDDWPQSLWTATVRALGAVPRSSALDFLTWLLRDADGTQMFLVQQVGRVAEATHSSADYELQAMLIGYCDSMDASLRREACMTLGKLQCAEGLDALIDRLSDQKSAVREAAYWSLQEITGKRMKAEPVRWRAWYSTEEAWWRHEFADARAGLYSDDLAVVGAAIRSIGGRKLRRNDLAVELLPLLEDNRKEVVCMAIAGLGALGSAVAVDSLVELLESDLPSVRQLALQALRSITGRKDLPADRDAWVDPWQRA